MRDSDVFFRWTSWWEVSRRSAGKQPQIIYLLCSSGDILVIYQLKAARSRSNVLFLAMERGRILWLHGLLCKVCCTALVFFSAFEIGSFADVAGCPENIVPWYDWYEYMSDVTWYRISALKFNPGWQWEHNHCENFTTGPKSEPSLYAVAVFRQEPRCDTVIIIYGL